MVRQLVQVALDMRRRERAATVCEERVNGVPRQQRTVESARQVGLVVMVGNARRHTRQLPRLRVDDAVAGLRVLKVVDIRRIVLSSAGGLGNEMGEVATESNLRRLLHVEERNLVEHVREPLALGLPVDIDAPQRVAQRFRAHGNLRGESLLMQVLNSTANLEFLREFVFEVESEHALAYLSVVGIGLKAHVDGRSGVDIALVKNCHLAGRVVNAIVATLDEHRTSGRHLHAALRHVDGSERNDICRRATELAHHHIFILLGYLLGGGLRGIVKLGERILVGNRGRHARKNKRAANTLTKRLCLWEKHASVLYSIALHVVEAAVAAGFHIIVEAVGSHHLYEQFVFHLCLGNIRQIHSCGVALILHVETELAVLYCRCEEIHVLHHQPPV